MNYQDAVETARKRTYTTVSIMVEDFSLPSTAHLLHGVMLGFEHGCVRIAVFGRPNYPIAGFRPERVISIVGYNPTPEESAELCKAYAHAMAVGGAYQRATEAADGATDSRGKKERARCNRDLKSATRNLARDFGFKG